MNSTPLFTIITVTWNASSTIGATLASVTEQTFRNFEYLVVDGASTDDTLDLVRASGIAETRIFSERDAGLYDAMNKAIELACGQYLIWLNAGDAFAAPDALSRLAAAAENLPGIIYGQTQLVDADRNVVGMRHLTAPAVLTPDSFKQGMVVCHQAFVARRDLVPPYDLRYRFSADYDWCIKVLKRSEHNAYLGDRPLISYLNEGVTTRNHRASLKERFLVMRDHYGTKTAIVRHLGFIPRALRRKLKR